MNDDTLVKRLLKEQALENKIKVAAKERQYTNSNFQNYFSVGLSEKYFMLTQEIQSGVYKNLVSFKLSKTDLDTEEYKNIISVELIKLIGAICVMELEEFLRES